MNEFYLQLEDHRGQLSGFLRSILGDHHQAEDATQDVILKALKAERGDGYTENGKLSSWLFQIARNHAFNILKSRKEFQQLETAPEVADPAPSALQLLTHREGIEALWRAVELLPIREKEVVEMRLLDEIPFDEIATRTGAPMNRVRANAQREEATAASVRAEIGGVDLSARTKSPNQDQLQGVALTVKDLVNASRHPKRIGR